MVMNHEEYAIQCAVWEHYQRYGRPGTFLCHPFNRAKNAREGKMAKNMGVVAGVPDLVGCMDGFFFSLEIKTQTGVLSNDQGVCRDAILGAGGIYVVAHGLNEALTALGEAKFL